jgi:hypothetical protein
LQNEVDTLVMLVNCQVNIIGPSRRHSTLSGGVPQAVEIDKVATPVTVKFKGAREVLTVNGKGNRGSMSGSH